MRTLAAPIVVARPTGARIRTRLRLTPADAAVVWAVGEHLGRLSGADLARRCRLGPAHRPKGRPPRTALQPLGGSDHAHFQRSLGAGPPQPAGYSGGVAPRGQQAPGAPGDPGRADPKLRPSPAAGLPESVRAVRKATAAAAPASQTGPDRGANRSRSGVGVPGWPSAGQASP